MVVTHPRGHCKTQLRLVCFFFSISHDSWACPRCFTTVSPRLRATRAQTMEPSGWPSKTLSCITAACHSHRRICCAVSLPRRAGLSCRAFAGSPRYICRVFDKEWNKKMVSSEWRGETAGEDLAARAKQDAIFGDLWTKSRGLSMRFLSYQNLTYPYMISLCCGPHSCSKPPSFMEVTG